MSSRFLGTCALTEGYSTRTRANSQWAVAATSDTFAFALRYHLQRNQRGCLAGQELAAAWLCRSFHP